MSINADLQTVKNLVLKTYLISRIWLNMGKKLKKTCQNVWTKTARKL